MTEPCFFKLGQIIGLDDEELRNFDQKIGWNEGAWQITRGLIIESKRSDPVIFCLEDCLVMQYGHTLTLKWFSTHCPSSGDKWLGINEIFDSSKGLSSDNLRDIFVTIETIVFKIVHIKMEQQRKSYTRNDGGFNSWCQRLCDKGLIDESVRNLARQFYKTRNEFAHTIQSIDKIKYQKQPLGRCYGNSGATRDPSLQNFFVDDVFKLTNALLGIFQPIQSQQLDADIFRQALDQIRRP